MAPNKDKDSLDESGETAPLLSPISDVSRSRRNSGGSSFVSSGNVSDIPSSPDLLSPYLDPEKLVYSSNRTSYADLPPALKVYTRRWWILLVFSLLSFSQSWIWITYSSVSSSAKDVFGWSDTTIALMADWGNIPFIFMVLPICWILDRKGLRLATVFSAVLMFIGTALKCVTSHSPYGTPLIHVGQFLNGVSGIVFCGATVQLSSVWFPSHQRTTATSIMTLSNVMGIAFGYFICPVFVEHHPIPACNITSLSCHNLTVIHQEHVENQRNEIMFLTYCECGLAMFLMLCTLAYFPKQPPLPPTASASLERIKLGPTLSSLFRNKNFWIISMGFAITNAVCTNWLTMLGPALEPFGISQAQTGMMGTVSILTGGVVSLIMGRIVDLLGGKIKAVLVISWVIGCANFTWYTLLFTKVIQPTMNRLYPAVIVAGVMAFSGSPLYMELCVEVAYPLQEGVVGTILQTIYNIIGSAFLAVFLVPGIGVSWMNYCLIACTIVGMLLALFTKETYNRSEVDKADQEKQKANREDYERIE